MRHVALGLGDAASWESAWQQHKFVLELAAAHASRDSASRGVPLSKLSELCTQKGLPPLTDPKNAHNHVNCMVAAGLLGKRDAHIKDRNKDRGASTSVVYLARFAPADAAAAAAASGETRMVSESELPILGGALFEALEGPDATEGLMTDKQLMGVLVRTLRSASGAFRWSEEDTSDRNKMNKLFARARAWLIKRGDAACATAVTTVTDEKTRKQEVKEMDALRLTSAMPSAVAAAPRSAAATRSADDALDAADEARFSAPLLKPVGGNWMQLETRPEDSLVSLCALAGKAGVRISDAARALGFGVKDFSKRAAKMYEGKDLAFEVEVHSRREGKMTNKYMYRAGFGPGGGASASAAAAAKKRERADLVLDEARRRGYLFHRSVGRWLRDEEARRRRARDPSDPGPKEEAYGPKIVGPIVELLVASGDLRRETVYKPAIDARAEQDARDVLFERGFPTPTDAMKRAIGEEAARIELAEHSRRRDPASSSAAVEVDQSVYVSKKAAIGAFRGNEGAETGSARVRGGAASLIKTRPPKTAEEGERLRRRTTRHARDVAAMTGGVLDAVATRARHAHAFLATEAFSEDAAASDASAGTENTHSTALDLAALFQKRAPLELSLYLFGAPDALRAAPAETAARLAAAAASGARLETLSDEDLGLVLGEDRDKHVSKPLSKILRFLCVCELARESEADLPDGRRALRWSLARRARFERVDDSGVTHEDTFDVTNDEGVASYWDGLERAFKPALVLTDEPVKIKGAFVMTEEGVPKTKKVLRAKEKHKNALTAFPNAGYIDAKRREEGVKDGEPGKTRGLCASKCWSRARDVSFSARVALLDGFERFRLRAYAAKLAELGAAAETSGEARARAAAKLSVLSEWTLPEPVIAELVGSVDGLGDVKRDGKRVRKAWDDDQTRLLNDLFEDGSVSKEDVEAAHPDEKAKLRNDGYARLDPARSAKRKLEDAEAETSAGAVATTAPEPARAKDRERAEWSLEEDAALLVTIARRTILGDVFAIETRTESYGDVVEGRTAQQTLSRWRRLVGKQIDPTTKKVSEEDVKRGDDVFAVIEGFRARRHSASAETRATEALRRSEWERVGFWCSEEEDLLRKETHRILVAHPKSSNNAYYTSPLGRALFGGVKPANAPKHGGGAVAGQHYPKRDAARRSRKRTRGEDADEDSDDDLPLAAYAAFVKPKKKKKGAKGKKRTPKQTDFDDDFDDDAPLARFVVDSDAPSSSDSDSDAPEERLADDSTFRDFPGLPDFVSDPERASRLAAALAALTAALAEEGDAFFENPAGLERLAEAHGADAAERVVRTLTDAKHLETRQGETRLYVTPAFGLWRAEENEGVPEGDAEGGGSLTGSGLSGLSRARTLTTLAAAARGARLRVEDGAGAGAGAGAGDENLPNPAAETEAGFKRLRVTADGARGGGALAEIQAGDADAARAARAAAARAAAAAASIPVDQAAAVAAAVAAGVRGVSASELAETLGGAATAFACERTLQAAADAGALRAVNAYDVLRFFDPSSAPSRDAGPGALPWLVSGGSTDAALLAKFKRFAFDTCAAFPGSDVGTLARKMHPTLAPVAGVALVELMLVSGELATRATSAPAAADGAPPALLMREETRVAQTLAEQAEEPRRHIFPPEDTGKVETFFA